MANALTEEQLAVQVLRQLTVTEANETPSAEDIQTVLDWYPQVWEMLNTEGLTNWAIGSDIPNQMSPGVTLILTEWVAPEFGLRYDGRSAQGMSLLRRQIQQRKSYKPVRFQDF